MKKNGFTLVELLAVIIILAILYLFVMPKVTDLIKDGNKTDEYIIQNKIITAAKEYTSNYDTRFLNDFINIGYSKYINKEDLINNKLLDENELDSIGFFKVKVTLKEDNKLEYTISYDDSGKILLSVNLNGGSMISDPTGEYEVGSTVTLNTPTKFDYEFSHWSIEVGNSILSGNMLTIGNINTTIKANWFKKITLTIDLNGGIGNNQGGIYSSNSTITLEEPTKDDHVFAGWKIVSGDAVLSGNNLTFGTEDISIKATWFKKVTEFAYIGSEQEFIVPATGYYRLETWGAQGGNVFGGTNGGSVYGVVGGYGGYSTGVVYLTKGTKLYINVGSQGATNCVAKTSKTVITCNGGYNGGGKAVTGDPYGYVGGGGGATHIALLSGLLSTLSSKQDQILLVAGGGGGAFYYNYDSAGARGYGGAGGGASGTSGYKNSVGINPSTPGTQTTGAGFGFGGEKASPTGYDHYAGGGAGLYGGNIVSGNGSDGAGGAGGSGYIGNNQLINKNMYCYNCTASSDNLSKTNSALCSSVKPISSCNKMWDGYAKIIYIGDTEPHSIEFPYTGTMQEFVVPKTGKYKIELWGAQGGNEYEFWNSDGLKENNVYGGYGAYTRGEILLNKGDILYIYVGEAGTFGKLGINSTSTVGQGAVATFNGGGAGGTAGGSSSFPYQNYTGGNSGGGATDVRLVSGSWNDTTSLRSRIMVAGGGGGFVGYDFQSVDYADNSNIGAAGGLISEEGYNITKHDGVDLSFSSGSLANQTSGNAFGIGGTGSNSGYTTYCAGHNGGGGGYYGGGGASSSGYYCFKLGGGGGSSYISGHTGCVAIKSETDTSAKSGCTTGTLDNSCSIHYSNKIFTNTMMIDGRGYLWTNTKEDLVQMPSPYGYDYEKGVGHNGNGYAKITYINE